MRHSKFSTVSLVLYNLPPAFQLCFHISTFQNNKTEITKSSPLRIPSKHSKLELGIQIYLLATTHTKILISPNKPQKKFGDLNQFQSFGSHSSKGEAFNTQIQLSLKQFLSNRNCVLSRHSSEKDPQPELKQKGHPKTSLLPALQLTYPPPPSAFEEHPFLVGICRVFGMGITSPPSTCPFFPKGPGTLMP